MKCCVYFLLERDVETILVSRHVVVHDMCHWYSSDGLKLKHLMDVKEFLKLIEFLLTCGYR